MMFLTTAPSTTAASTKRNIKGRPRSFLVPCSSTSSCFNVAPSSFRHLSFLLALTSLMPTSYISSVNGQTIYNIPCGDTAAFEAAFQNLVPKDVMLLEAGSSGSPCIYDFTGSPNNNDFGTTLPSANFGTDDGFVISGSSSNPEDTVLLTSIDYGLDANVLFENLSLDAQNESYGGAVYEEDNDRAHVFRNCILKSGPNMSANEANVLLYSHILTLVNTGVVNGGTSQPGIGTIGIEPDTSDDYINFVMLSSKVVGFDIGIEAGRTWVPGDPGFQGMKIFGNNLSSNTVACQVYNWVSGNTDPCALSSQVPNTPKGKKISIFKNQNRLSEDGNTIPLRIKFPEVTTKGETIVYRIPSAFPEPDPILWGIPTISSGIGEPQYYRFDSTAKLKKKAGRVDLYFKKSHIDPNFADPASIVVAMYDYQGWRSAFVPTKVVTRQGQLWYRVKVPKRKRLNNILIAFLEQ